MKTDLSVKIAAFCRELGDPALQDMARKHNQEPEFQRAEESVRAGRIGPELEADLDALDAMLRRVEGQGLYPAATQTVYTGLPPGVGMDTGAQWWACPRSWCTGRGRVRPGQDTPVCAATGEPLVAGPLPR